MRLASKAWRWEVPAQNPGCTPTLAKHSYFSVYAKLVYPCVFKSEHFPHKHLTKPDMYRKCFDEDEVM